MPPILPKKTWLERFATHLRLLRPQLSALEAAYVAMDEFVACDFDPKVAAAVYDEFTGEASTSAWRPRGSNGSQLSSSRGTASSIHHVDEHQGDS